MSLIAFVGLVFIVIGLIYFYLWKRLVRDTTRKGLGRRIGTVAVILFAVLAPATLIGVRSGYVEWLAWPGYLSIALMFYLLVTLAALEIPRLAVNLWWRARGERPAASAHGPAVAGAATSTGSSGTATATGSSEAASTSLGAVPASASAAGGQDLTVAGAESATATNGPGGSPAQDAGSTPGSAGPADRIGTAGPGDRAGNADPAERQGMDRRLLLARGAAIFAGLTAAGVTGYGVKNALGGPQLDRFQFPLAKLPRAMDGTRLAVVSDIHLGPLTGANHAGRIVQLINSVDADIVCIVGDLVDGSVAELGRFATPLADIQARRGAYFVTGNHEYYSGFEEWVAEVDRLGVKPLRNERLELDGLDLAGVNDIGGVEFGDGPDLQRALGDRDTTRPVVLMAHQPVVARDAAPFGVDLQVSGHTHGGQMAPFNLLVKLEQPVVSGYGEVDGVPVYVTNGAGFWGPPVRVGAPPQVTVIELRTP